MNQDCEICGASPGEEHTPNCLAIRRVENRGVWFCYYTDYSGFAVFEHEIEALRYAVEKSMQCEFRPWGDLR